MDDDWVYLGVERVRRGIRRKNRKIVMEFFAEIFYGNFSWMSAFGNTVEGFNAR